VNWKPELFMTKAMAKKMAARGRAGAPFQPFPDGVGRAGRGGPEEEAEITVLTRTHV